MLILIHMCKCCESSGWALLKIISGAPGLSFLIYDVQYCQVQEEKENQDKLDKATGLFYPEL